MKLLLVRDPILELLNQIKIAAVNGDGWAVLSLATQAENAIERGYSETHTRINGAWYERGELNA